jgi:hypothetical protein
VDAIETAFMGYLEDRRAIPQPSPVKRRAAITLPAQTEANWRSIVRCGPAGPARPSLQGEGAAIFLRWTGCLIYGTAPGWISWKPHCGPWVKNFRCRFWMRHERPCSIPLDVQAEVVARGIVEVLADAQVAFRGEDGGVAQG